MLRCRLSVHVFVYGLFNDAVSTSEYLPSNEWMIVNKAVFRSSVRTRKLFALEIFCLPINKILAHEATTK
jgi:hypothetical protein